MMTSLALFAAHAAAPSASVQSEPIKMTLVPSGAVEKAGGYRPMQAVFGATATAKAPKGLASPQYGTLELGGKKIAFALSEPEGKPATLVVDANGNGNLADDKPAEWAEKKRGTSSMYFGSAKVDIGKGQPVGVNFYRFDPKDPQRAALKSTLMYYTDYGYELSFDLDGKPYTAFIAGDPGDKTAFAIDRNNDGKMSYNYEYIAVDRPFNYTGTTYVLHSKGGKLAFDKAETAMEMMALPPNLSVGQKTLPIVATTLDGSSVDLMNDYKGKIVMVDFWATWCGPCLGELPNVKAAYKANHDKGFEILGISFDRENMADKLKEFTAKNEMPWRQVYEGKFWETTIGKRFDVSAIPFTLLIDGDTGEILAQGDEMRGEGLSKFIEAKLAAKRARN